MKKMKWLIIVFILAIVPWIGTLSASSESHTSAFSFSKGNELAWWHWGWGGHHRAYWYPGGYHYSHPGYYYYHGPYYRHHHHWWWR